MDCGKSRNSSLLLLLNRMREEQGYYFILWVFHSFPFPPPPLRMKVKTCFPQGRVKPMQVLLQLKFVANFEIPEFVKLYSL